MSVLVAQIGGAIWGSKEAAHAGARAWDASQKPLRDAERAGEKAKSDAQAEIDRKKKEDADALESADKRKKKDLQDRQLAADAQQSKRQAQVNPNKKQTYGGTILTSPLGLLGGPNAPQRTLIGG